VAIRKKAPVQLGRVIAQYVRLFNSAEKPGCRATYAKCLADMAEVRDFKRITVANMGVVRKHLYNWEMGLALGKHRKGWERELRYVLASQASQISKFRKLKLESSKLEPLASDIRQCFNVISEKTTPIAAGKVLHLLCPDLFPPWDSAIAHAMWAERVQDCPKGCPRLSDRDDLYLSLMMQVQNIARVHLGLLNGLSKEFGGRRIPKLVDDFLLWAAHRPLYFVRDTLGR
jgi:hypothetical protein